LIVFHPCSKLFIRFLNWIDPPTTNCLRLWSHVTMVLVPSHGAFPRFDASMIAAPSRRWLQVGQQQTTHHRFDAARGYFRRRISWEWCNDGMALPDMSSIDLYSCYLTVCYGNHGPSSSMIDDLPWFTYSQWWFSIAKWRNRCYQLWVRFWDP